MGSISLRNFSLTIGQKLFGGLDLVIGEGDRVGLVAGNGRGKTSLLCCMAGEAEPSAGDVVRSRGLTIGFVEQDVPASLMEHPLRHAVELALPTEARETESWRVGVALDEFETPAEFRDRPVRALSGGWQRLTLIMRVWVNRPDALLFDEPTNHLDLGKLFWLERWMNAALRGMPVVIASHDRDFLDATTNRTLFLRPETSRYFALPYSRARAALAKEDEATAQKFENDIKEATKLRKQAARLTNIGINSGSDLLTVKAKYLKERAARIEAAAPPAHTERSGEIRLGGSGTHAKVLLALENVAVTTPAGTDLFRIGKLHVFQGDRIVLLGANGAGKSQLVKLLHTAIAAPGSVAGIKPAASVVLGYIDQDMSQLSPAETPDEIVARFGVGDARRRALLAAAGFAIEKQERRVGELSLGQRARLGFLALRLAEPNFYLMDEPTNHVDIDGRERLEDEILKHGTTSILVSHDRSFVRNVGTRFLVIGKGCLRETEEPGQFFATMAAGG